jgi:hypothetical protein
MLLGCGAEERRSSARCGRPNINQRVSKAGLLSRSRAVNPHYVGVAAGLSYEGDYPVTLVQRIQRRRRMTKVAEKSGDFDFQIGSWLVRHRRLKDRLQNCGEWEDFDGTSQMRTILGGNGNVEDNVIHFPSGTYKAIALRSYDAASRSWAIWWLSSSAPHNP